MNKNFIVFLLALIIFLGSAADAFSQMIDYSRIKKRSKIQRQLISQDEQTVNPVETKSAVAGRVENTQRTAKQGDIVKTKPVKKQELFEELITSQPIVKDRIERIYDLNRDGRLQKNEIIDMYQDVILSVNRKGSFLVGSDLLIVFDVNEDGQISRAEASTLNEKIN